MTSGAQLIISNSLLYACLSGVKCISKIRAPSPTVKVKALKFIQCTSPKELVMMPIRSVQFKIERLMSQGRDFPTTVHLASVRLAVH